MTVKFVKKAPLNLWGAARATLTGTKQVVYEPQYWSEGPTQTDTVLRETTAMLLASRVVNTTGTDTTVDIFVRRSGSRSIAPVELIAGAGDGTDTLELQFGQLVEGTADSYLYDWSDPADPVRVSLPSAFTDAAVSVENAWTSDGQYLAMASAGDLLYVFDMSADPRVAVTWTDADLTVFAGLVEWSPDDSILLVGLRGAPRSVRALTWDGAALVPAAHQIPDLPARVTSISWRGNYVSVTTAPRENAADQILYVFQYSGATGYTLLSTPTGLDGTKGVQEARFSPDGRYLAIISPDSLRVRVLDCQSYPFTELLPDTVPTNPAQFHSLGWHPDSRQFAFGTGATPYLAWYSLATGQLRQQAPKITILQRPVSGIEFSPSLASPTLAIFYNVQPDNLIDSETFQQLDFWDWNGGTPTRNDFLPNLPGTSGSGQWSPDGGFFFCTAAAAEQEIITAFDNFSLIDRDGLEVLVNGSFEITTGMLPGPLPGVLQGQIPGWTDPEAPTRENRIYTIPYGAARATQGSNYFVARAFRPADNPSIDRYPTIRQAIPDLEPGDRLLLSFDMVANPGSVHSVRVLWNGEVVQLDGVNEVTTAVDRPLMTGIALTANATGALPGKLALQAGEALVARSAGQAVDLSVSYLLTTQEPET